MEAKVNTPLQDVYEGIERGVLTKAVNEVATLSVPRICLHLGYGCRRGSNERRVRRGGVGLED